MNGWLVVNEFVMTEKFQEIFAMLLRAAMDAGINMTRKTNAEMWTMLGACNYRLHDFFTVGCPFQMGGNEMIISAREIGLDIPDFILFWDKDIRLASELERQGLRVFNNSMAIGDCDDKGRTFLKLQASGIRQPRTYICPKKFHADGLYDKKFLDNAAAALGFPCIVKEVYGSFGKQVHLVNNMNEMLQAVMEAGDRPYLIQEYIASSRGRDIRVQVVGGKVVAAMQRFNNGDFRSNITNGGDKAPHRATQAQAEVSVRACQLLQLDFGGVDLMFGPQNEPVLCEVNSNAHFKNLYDCTGVNTADYIMQHIIRELS